MTSVIDLRSDTATLPTARMRAAMTQADVGDDVEGEDPTVNRLEAITAELLGKQAAIFATSGTQSNLLGLLSQCERGDEYIVGHCAHTYQYEGGGAAVLGSIQPQPIEFEPDGTLELGKVEAAIKPDDFHFARTRMLCLENTQAGKVLPLAYMQQASALARRHGLAVHLDAARGFNAAVALNVPISSIAGPFDTVSVCLSKGLGAPVGSLLCGSSEVIARARRWRKMLGGGMRQAGVIAAAGIVALTEHVERLAEDHEHAQRLAAGLAEIDELDIDPAGAQTNMVFVDMPVVRAKTLRAQLRREAIIISSDNPIRLVTHLNISAADVDRTIAAFKHFFHG